MFRIHNIKIFKEILKEDLSLRAEFYSILDSMLKYYANFENSKAADKFNEYLQFCLILTKFSKLPKTQKKGQFKEQVILTIDDLRIAALIRLFPLKLSKFQKRIQKELEVLTNSGKDFCIKMYFEHILDLLHNNEFRKILSSKSASIVCDSEINYGT